MKPSTLVLVLAVFSAIGVLYWFVAAPSPSRSWASGSGLPEIIASPNETAELDRYSIREYQSRVFDNGETIASVRAGFLNQRTCVQQGVRFDSYDELFVEKLDLTFHAPQGSYAVDRVIARLMGGREIPGADNAPDQVAPDDEIAENRQAFSQGPVSTPVARLIGDGIHLRFASAGKKPMEVTGGAFQANIADFNLVKLEPPVVFHQDGNKILTARQGIWAIDENLFHLAGAAVHETPMAVEPGKPTKLACRPDPESGWHCEKAVSYPEFPPDFISLTANKLQNRIYRKIGLCDSMLGRILCGIPPR